MRALLGVHSEDLEGGGISIIIIVLKLHNPPSLMEIGVVLDTDNEPSLRNSRSRVTASETLASSLFLTVHVCMLTLNYLSMA